MKKYGLSLLIFLLVALLAAGPGVFAAAAQTVAEKILVPDFTLPYQEGVLSLSDFRGKVVVLNFWASWCPPCRSELEELQQLHERLSETGEAVLLLINQIDGRQETIQSGSGFLKNNNYTMTNLFDDGQVGQGIFGIPGLPTTLVIDEEGYFVSYVVGPTNAAHLLKMIEEAR